jgi:hypothetical protein
MIEETQKLKNRVAKLESFIESLCYCPCCEGILECSEHCTIKQDEMFVGCTEVTEKREAAREALKA